MENNENILILEKSKKGFLQVIFGRTTVILVMLLVQFGLMLTVMKWLEEYTTYAFTGGVLIGLAAVLHILNNESSPTVKITWIILVMLLPIFGSGMYLWIHLDIGHRIVHKKLEKNIEDTKNLLPEDDDVLDKIRIADPDLMQLVTYMGKYGGFAVHEETQVKYMATGEEYFSVVLEELEKAEKYIFMEYFIIEEGYMWGRILDVLKRKADQGVEVRVMYDGTCALGKVPYSYPEKLKELGIKAKMFAPPRPFVSTHYNNRDHRKILVIDGHTGITGGVNLADEYINRRTLFGHWKDTGICLKGKAVSNLLLLFLQMWNVNEKEEDYEKYISSVQALKTADRAKTEGYVIPYGDNPMDDEKVGEMVYMDILNKASRYVHIMTPYLILDSEMVTALNFAAKRGVDVKIILPHIPDKEYAYCLAKAHYKQLVKAGVKIYEYEPGFVHAKSFVCDDKKAVVGTINLDYRSLYHHFENGVYMYQVDAVKDIEEDFQETLKKCIEVTEETIKREKISRKVMGMIFKVIAPLM